MRTLYYLLLLLVFPVFVFSQQFNVVGTRSQGFAGWDIPSPKGVNQDPNGNYFVYVDESQTPRNPELVKLNMPAGSWEDLTMNGLDVEATSTTEGIVMDDGSVYAGIRSFNNNYYGYRILPTAVVEDLGTNVPFTEASGIYCQVAMDSEGSFYVGGALSSGFVSKYSSNAWTMLPNFNTVPIDQFPVMESFDIATDENNTLYCVFAERRDDGSGDQFKVRVSSFTTGATLWSPFFQETETSIQVSILVVSSTEIYISYAKLTGDGEDAYYVKKFDGTAWSDVGQPILYTYGFCGEADMIKLSSNNTLYISNCAEIYEYDEAQNTWVALANNVSDGGDIASFNDRFFENNDGNLVNVLGYTELSIIEYVPANMGTEDVESSLNATIYPNPTSNSVKISLASQMIEKFEIYNAEGALLKSHPTAPTSEVEVDLSQYPEGVYLLRINDKESYKVIKK